MSRSVSFFLILTLSLLLGCTASEDSGLEPVGDIPRVGPILVPQEIDNLETALVAAQDGDTILLAPGTYQGPVDVFARVTIGSQGGGEVVLRSNRITIEFFAGSSGSVLRDLTVEGVGAGIGVGFETTPVSGVLLENLTVRATRGEAAAFCIQAENAAGLTVRNCQLESDQNGIGTRGTCPDLLVDGVSITLTGSNATGGLVLADVPNFQGRRISVVTPVEQFGPFSGLELAGSESGSTGVVLEDCTFEVKGADSVGVRILRSPGAIVRRCRIDAGEEGLTLGHLLAQPGKVAGATVEDNQVNLTQTPNFSGLNVIGVSDPVVRRNRVTNAARGILLSRYDGFTLEENEVDGCGLGLRFQDADEALGGNQRVLRNFVSRSGAGLSFDASGSGLTLVANCALIANLTGLTSDGSPVVMINNIISLSESAVTNNGAEEIPMRNNIVASSSVDTLVGPVGGDYNNFFQNADNQAPLGPNGISSINLVNPSDLTLMAGSPQIDGGDPDPVFNDNLPPGQGTERNDMGVYGGPFGGSFPLQLLQSLLEGTRITP